VTPTARTLTALRRSGYAAGVVERFVAPPGRPGFRVDLFSVADIIAVRPGQGFLLVQATSASNAASRLRKARQLADRGLRAWLAAGGRFEIWGWSRRAGKWTVRRVALTGADLAPTEVAAPPRRRRQLGQRGLFDRE
jgi:hypothetical protein